MIDVDSNHKDKNQFKFKSALTWIACKILEGRYFFEAAFWILFSCKLHSYRPSKWIWPPKKFGLYSENQWITWYMQGGFSLNKVLWCILFCSLSCRRTWSKKMEVNCQVWWYVSYIKDLRKIQRQLPRRKFNQKNQSFLFCLIFVTHQLYNLAIMS